MRGRVRFFLLMALCLCAMPFSVQARPFILPIAADVQESATDGKGWQETGVARMTFVQAEGQFRATMAQSGWKYLHTVSLSSRNERSLMTWKKGGRELTLMLWRIDVGRTGFSWGVSAGKEKKGKIGGNHES